MARFGFDLRGLLILGFLTVSPAWGAAQQIRTAGQGGTAGTVAAARFEVVSIRQNKIGGAQKVEATPDGWHMTNMPFAVAIQMAFVPKPGGAAFFTSNNTQGMPDWAIRDRYDVDARVPEADLAEWQNASSQPALLRAMLQPMLAERCGLAAHIDAKEVPVYALTVGKSGPKFAVSDPNAVPPPGARIPGGGVVVPEDNGNVIHFYQVSMALVATYLSNIAGRQVKDETGLGGRYDVRLQKPEAMLQPGESGQEDLGASVFSVVEQIGLKLVPAKGQIDVLVIDHIERPSEN